ncbi:hypothetical protein BHM03_00034340 [Ensete ventricosum]|uniref:Uncharacterized protein n=1 Tax=Ensete ventricosum TaxID=4639 RepID=A0A445MJ61_ENSVE|nr:hypothetical protein BHM03_00034340 [Ensete ventricosum]
MKAYGQLPLQPVGSTHVPFFLWRESRDAASSTCYRTEVEKEDSLCSRFALRLEIAPGPATSGFKMTLLSLTFKRYAHLTVFLRRGPVVEVIMCASSTANPFGEHFVNQSFTPYLREYPPSDVRNVLGGAPVVLYGGTNRRQNKKDEAVVAHSPESAPHSTVPGAPRHPSPRANETPVFPTPQLRRPRGRSMGPIRTSK